MGFLCLGIGLVIFMILGILCFQKTCKDQSNQVFGNNHKRCKSSNTNNRHNRKSPAVVFNNGADPLFGTNNRKKGNKTYQKAHCPLNRPPVVKTKCPGNKKEGRYKQGRKTKCPHYNVPQGRQKALLLKRNRSVIKKCQEYTYRKQCCH